MLTWSPVTGLAMASAALRMALWPAATTAGEATAPEHCAALLARFSPHFTMMSPGGKQLDAAG